MGGGSARFGFWALVLHVLFAWFYAVSCFGSGGVRYRSILHAWRRENGQTPPKPVVDGFLLRRYSGVDMKGGRP